MVIIKDGIMVSLLVMMSSFAAWAESSFLDGAVITDSKHPYGLGRC